MLYDNGLTTLPEPLVLPYSQRKDIAQKQFEQSINRADGFLLGGPFYFNM